MNARGDVEAERLRQRLKFAAALIWLLGFSAVFFSQDLPNSGVPAVNRRDLWLELPVLLQNCVVQDPDAPPSGWRFLPQRFPAIAPALLILAGAFSIGRLLLRVLRIHRRARLEQALLAYGVGMSAVSLLTLGTGLMAQLLPGVMTAPVLGGTLGLSVVCDAGLWWRQRRTGSRSGGADSCEPEAARQAAAPASREVSWLQVLVRGQIPFGVLARILVSLVLTAFLAAMALGALLPSSDFDVKEYHLQGPKEYFQNGYISWLPHNVYTSFPFLTEMFALLGMVLSGDWFTGALSGKLVLMTFAPATGLAVFCLGHRWFDVRVGWAAALIHLTAPWTYRISIIAYAEGGLTFYLTMTLFALLLVRETAAGQTSGAGPERRNLTLLTGLFAGSAMACKYPGVLSVIMPLGLALLWFEWQDGRRASRSGASLTDDSAGQTVLKRVLRTGSVYSAGVLLAVGLWLTKNTMETGNPVYPLLNSVFHGADWTPVLEANWKAAHGPPHHQPGDLLVKLADVTLKSDWLSPLYYGLAPLTLLVVRQRRLIGGLWLYAGFLFLSWWVLTHRIDRFWIPMLPVVSLLAGAGVWWSAERSWRYAASGLVGACVLFNLGFISTPLCGLNAWLGDYATVRRIAESSAGTIAAVNRMNLSPESRVLCVGEAQVFDARFSHVYNTVFDISIFEQWCSAAAPDTPPGEQPMRPAAAIRDTLARHGITHVLVNWQEILRYRTTYGYTDFVAPHRFDWLVEHGVLERGQLLTGLRELNSFSRNRNPEHSQQDQIMNWGPELIVDRDGKRFVILSQIYRVAPQGHSGPR